ncbi:MAG: CHAP domain-containing protein, partial [Eubacteriales bacterium]|nr:CHAP domain-containing protein [Eubacteriales bacterium]
MKKKILSLIISFAMMISLGILNPEFFSSPVIVRAAYENTWTNTGNQREDIVRVAETQIGYHEGSLEGTTNGSDNYTKYNAALYKINGSYKYAWCQSFVSWCARQAGVSTSVIKATAGTVDCKSTFIEAGVYHTGPYEGGNYIPQRGDIIYFYSEAASSKHHVGIVESCDGVTVNTIEGNTGTNDVKRKSYSVSYSKIRGYGVPDYVAPPHEPKWYESLSPVDVGTDFFAYIINVEPWKHLTNDNGNVVMT